MISRYQEAITKTRSTSIFSRNIWPHHKDRVDYNVPDETIPKYNMYNAGSQLSPEHAMLTLKAQVFPLLPTFKMRKSNMDDLNDNNAIKQDLSIIPHNH